MTTTISVICQTAYLLIFRVIEIVLAMVCLLDQLVEALISSHGLRPLARLISITTLDLPTWV
jgi:hypothetical protein